jgi:hypothetical protein
VEGEINATSADLLDFDFVQTLEAGIVPRE